MVAREREKGEEAKALERNPPVKGGKPLRI